MNNAIVNRCCNFCFQYKPEEIGDSDFGAVYADTPNCQKYLDTDPETEEDIPGFDREIERTCCEPDFWKILEVDKVVSDSFNNEVGDKNGKFDETLKLFKQRYEPSIPSETTTNQ